MFYVSIKCTNKNEISNDKSKISIDTKELSSSLELLNKYIKDLSQLTIDNMNNATNNFHIFASNNMEYVKEWMILFTKTMKKKTTQKNDQLSFITKQYKDFLINLYENDYMKSINNVNLVISGILFNNINDVIIYYKKLKQIVKTKYSKEKNFLSILALINSNLDILFQLRKIDQYCKKLKSQLPINSQINVIAMLLYLQSNNNNTQAIEKLLKDTDFLKIMDNIFNKIKPVDNNTKQMETKLLNMDADKINKIFQETNKNSAIIHMIKDILKNINLLLIK